MLSNVEVLSTSKNLPSRIRCLLQDTVDLRKSGWVNTKRSKAKLEKATTLKKIHKADTSVGVPTKTESQPSHRVRRSEQCSSHAVMDAQTAAVNVDRLSMSAKSNRSDNLSASRS